MFSSKRKFSSKTQNLKKIIIKCKKTNYMLFHKPSTKDDMLLKIPELVISTKLIKQKRYIKFLGVIVNECITWNNLIRTVKNKVSKM